jgi:hypothetical protein
MGCRLQAQAARHLIPMSMACAPSRAVIFLGSAARASKSARPPAWPVSTASVWTAVVRASLCALVGFHSSLTYLAHEPHSLYKVLQYIAVKIWPDLSALKLPCTCMPACSSMGAPQVRNIMYIDISITKLSISLWQNVQSLEQQNVRMALDLLEASARNAVTWEKPHATVRPTHRSWEIQSFACLA